MDKAAFLNLADWSVNLQNAADDLYCGKVTRYFICGHNVIFLINLHKLQSIVHAIDNLTVLLKLIKIFVNST